MSELRWHELQLVYELAECGSATAAAPRLGMSQPTVSRRLAALEAALGVRLFDRQAQRLVPTEAGAELSQTAARLQAQMDDVVRRVQGRDARPSGLVRVTGVQPLLRVLLPTLRTLLQTHPELALSLSSTPVPANLHRQEADVAVRVSSQPPRTLVGRRIAKFAYALYRRVDAPHDDRSVVGFPAPRGDVATQEWLDQVVPGARVRLRIDDDTLHHDAILAGLGAAQLTCMTGDRDPRLERVPDAPLQWGESLWVLTHEALRNSARVRVVLDAITAALVAERPSIEGSAYAPEAPQHRE